MTDKKTHTLIIKQNLERKKFMLKKLAWYFSRHSTMLQS